LSIIEILFVVIVVALMLLLMNFKEGSNSICMAVCDVAGMEYVKGNGDICICKVYGDCVDFGDYLYCEGAKEVRFERQDKVWS